MWTHNDTHGVQAAMARPFSTSGPLHRKAGAPQSRRKDAGKGGKRHKAIRRIDAPQTFTFAALQQRGASGLLWSPKAREKLAGCLNEAFGHMQVRRLLPRVRTAVHVHFRKGCPRM